MDFAAWYRREDYDRVLEVMDDGDKFPASFEEWEIHANHAVASAKARGVPLNLVTLDPQEFVDFCSDTRLPRGRQARKRYTIAKGAAQHRH